MSDAQLPHPDQVREFVIAGHGNLAVVETMLAADPALLNVAHPWSDNDTETAIQAAAHMGNRPIAEFLLAKGAPLEICTAAMLGCIPDVIRLLEQDPGLVHTNGAHGIPLLAHAALSGELAMLELLVQHGAKTGITDTLHNAVSHGYEEIARWCLENHQPDLSSQNFKGQTLLDVAREQKTENIIQLLQKHGATA